MNYRIANSKIDYALMPVPDNAYDAVFCDPPYGLGGKEPDYVELLTAWMNDEEYNTGKGFMASDWDVLPGPKTWRELLRVTKPGGCLFAFGGTRTVDLLGMAIRLAGWQRFDTGAWIYSSGFPKSYNLAKAAENHDWDGYGTALAPSWEPILMFRKPVDGTYAHNAEHWHCGGLNIEGCRIPLQSGDNLARNNKTGSNGWKNSSGGKNTAALEGNPTGRWPKNLLHDGSPDAVAQFPYTKSGSGRCVKRQSGTEFFGNTSASYGKESRPAGTEGISYGDEGSASRMFYCAKSAPNERHAGLDHLPGRQRDETRNAQQASMNGGVGNAYNRGSQEVKNHHPSVKPLMLTEYFSKMILPPEFYRPHARLLVPYCGSGSEMIGAMLAGWQHIDGIEMNESFVEIAYARLAHWDKVKAKRDIEESQLGLFDMILEGSN